MSKSKVDRKPKLNRREAFQAVASELDATFVAGKLSFGDKVHLEHGPWNLILDTYILNNGKLNLESMIHSTRESRDPQHVGPSVNPP